MTWKRSDKRETERVVCSGTCGQADEVLVSQHIVRWWCSRCWKQRHEADDDVPAGEHLEERL